MPLGLREMDIFRHVMESGSITGAAAALRISQPAVSKMLQQAEDRLGFPLFNRQGRQLQPTPQALALLPEVLRAFAALDTVKRMTGELHAGDYGTLTVAAIPALANSLLPKAICRLRAERAGVVVVLHVLPGPDVFRMVSDHRAELGAIIGPAGGPDTLAEDLGTTELGCLLPPDHPLCEREWLGPAELVDVPLIAPGSNWPLGTLVGTAFADANVPLRLAVEVPHASVACAMVREGCGVALMDGFGLLVAKGMGLAIRPFRPRMSCVSRLLRPRYRPLSRPAEDFRQILLEIAADMLSSCHERG